MSISNKELIQDKINDQYVRNGMGLFLAFPPSVNRAYRTTRNFAGVYKTKECKAWIEMAQKHIIENMVWKDIEIQKKPTPVEITIFQIHRNREVARHRQSNKDVERRNTRHLL